MRPISRSLYQSLTYRIMAVVLVMIAVITGIIYYHVKNYMVDEAKERYEGVLQRDHEEFLRRLSDVMVAAKNNHEAIEREVDYPESVMHHLERVLQVNPKIITYGIVYQPNYFPDRKHCLELIATHDSVGAIHLKNIENDSNAYLDRKWFKDCIEKDKSFWSDVYFEQDLIPVVTGRRQLMTYCLPVHNRQGKTVAVIGADLPLEYLKYEMTNDLQEIIGKYEKGCRHHSYNFVTDHNGIYILHPDEQRILNANFFEESKRPGNKVDAEVVARMKKGEQGSALVEIDGVPSWIYYRTVKGMDWMIAVVVPQEVIAHKGRMLNTIILIVVLLGLVAIYFICRQMIRNATRPLHFLARSAEEVAMGNFSSPLPDVKTIDEVRMLHDSFEMMQTSLSIYVDEVKRTTAEKAAFENEMNNARAIQMALVPNKFPPFPEHGDIDIYGMMEPAKSVGGDLFDYWLRDNRLFFCIGDVSGKGMPAALLMAVMKTMFRSEARRSDNAAAIIDAMNSNLCEENTEGYFVTMFVGILDLTTGRLDYCNAGHEAPLLSGKPLPVKRNKPIGALSGWNFEGQETEMKPGDMLFLYTDGLSDARNQTGKRFGRTQVAEFVGEQACDTAQQLVQLMAHEVHRYAADTEQSDDITLLAVKRSALIVHATMDDIERLKPFITDAALQAGIDAKEAKRLRAAVEEAVANVINYSQATSIMLKTEKSGGKLIVTIDDNGLPFDPTLGSNTDLSIPIDQRPSGGMGILMMQRMTDGMSYQRLGGHNILKLLKNI